MTGSIPGFQGGFPFPVSDGDSKELTDPIIGPATNEQMESDNEVFSSIESSSSEEGSSSGASDSEQSDTQGLGQESLYPFDQLQIAGPYSQGSSGAWVPGGVPLSGMPSLNLGLRTHASVGGEVSQKVFDSAKKLYNLLLELNGCLIQVQSERANQAWKPKGWLGRFNPLSEALPGDQAIAVLGRIGSAIDAFNSEVGAITIRPLLHTESFKRSLREETTSWSPFTSYSTLGARTAASALPLSTEITKLQTLLGEYVGTDLGSPRPPSSPQGGCGSHSNSPRPPFVSQRVGKSRSISPRPPSSAQRQPRSGSPSPLSGSPPAVSFSDGGNSMAKKNSLGKSRLGPRSKGERHGRRSKSSENLSMYLRPADGWRRHNQYQEALNCSIGTVTSGWEEVNSSSQPGTATPSPRGDLLDSNPMDLG